MLAQLFENINFWISLLIFFMTFVVIFSEIYNRAIVAFFGAICMVWTGYYLDFYSFEQVLQAVDFNTVLLLVGMMIIVTVLEKTGFFQYLALKTAKKSKGNFWLLLLFLAVLTTVSSMILDNVTTLVLIAPVTMIIAKLLKINPVPLLMSEALLSNIGGVATLVGDPPNIMIGSAAGFGFNVFLTHSFPVVLVVWVAVLFYLRFVYRKELKQPVVNTHSLKKIDEKKQIKNKTNLETTVVILLFVIILFLIHGYMHLPPSFVAIFGAGLLLLLVSPEKDPNNILKKIELSVLMFFISLFILVGGLEAAGVLEYAADLMLFAAEDNILLTALIILWISAILSAILDNIPMTISMIPILAFFQTKGIDGTNILWWALVFGVGFGGNATPIGSMAGMIITGKARSNKTPISTKEWMAIGMPTAIISLLIASYALIVFYPYFMK